MAIDAQLLFEDGLTINNSSGTAVSTNSIDLSATTQFGVGRPMYVVVQITSFTGTYSDSTLAISAVVDDANSDLSAASAIASLATLSSGAALAAGKIYVLPWPQADIDTTDARYAGLQFAETGTDSISYVVTAYLTDTPPAGNYTRT